MESHGNLLCHGESRPNRKIVVHRQKQRVKNLCRAFERRRCASPILTFRVLTINRLQCVMFHPNSLYLATGSSDWTARLWDVQRGSCVRVFIGHQGIISTIAISPDGRYLASAGIVFSIFLSTDFHCIFNAQARISQSISGILVLVGGSKR